MDRLEAPLCRVEEMEAAGHRYHEPALGPHRQAAQIFGRLERLVHPGRGVVAVEGPGRKMSIHHRTCAAESQ